MDTKANKNDTQQNESNTNLEAKPAQDIGAITPREKANSANPNENGKNYVDRWIMIFTGILAICNIALVIFTLIQIVDSRKAMESSNETTKRQIVLAERQFAEAQKNNLLSQIFADSSVKVNKRYGEIFQTAAETENRAYIVVREQGIKNYGIGKFFYPYAIFVNDGKTPAYNIKFIIRRMIHTSMVAALADTLKWDEIKNYPINGFAQNGTVGANQEFIATADYPIPAFAHLITSVIISKKVN